MQIKEFEALTLKECLQQVRSAMGPDAVILETRKFRKGGLWGFGARDAVAIVAATGITVNGDAPQERTHPQGGAGNDGPPGAGQSLRPQETDVSGRGEQIHQRGSATAAMVAARGVYGNHTADRTAKRESPVDNPVSRTQPDEIAALLETLADSRGAERSPRIEAARNSAAAQRNGAAPPAVGSNASASRSLNQASAAPKVKSPAEESSRFSYLERAMGEIRECLHSLQREQREGHDRTVSAVVSAVAPAVTAVSAASYAAISDDIQSRFPELQARMKEMGVCDELIQELFDQLPDMGAWSDQAQQALAVSAMRDLIARRISSRGAIELTPGRLKAVALIGPTGVGKTTTIAKLAAHFALVQGKRVALLTVDTYRIAAIEQLKTYSQIIGLPVSVAYNHAEVPPIIEQYSDYDLLLIDTAGRSQKHIMQVGELKSLLETLECETHLVLSAPIKEQDMMEAARRFSAARVDRIIFSKLDETSSYGTLLNVADRTGIPLSYLTTGQMVPEDLEIAEGSRLASLIVE